MRLEDITNRIVSASATIIAVVAMATAVYQAKLMRDQAKAAVWPYLLIGNSGEGGYSRIVQNVGLGPALIRAFEVRVHGKPVRSWKEAADSMGITLTFRNSRSTTFGSGIVIPVNTTVALIELPDSADIRAIRSKVDDALTTEVCYCSLYGDCWIAVSMTHDPTHVSKCVQNPKTTFQQ